MVFNYDAAFADVVLHAFFVVVETAICCVIAQQLGATIRMRGVLEEQVSLTAEQVAMDIARQTNILAVNASIEASRSGNSGGGFGVIADQVRDLAVRTTEASTEIDNLISNSVGKVESSARDIESIAEGFSELNSATQNMKVLELTPKAT